MLNPKGYRDIGDVVIYAVGALLVVCLLTLPWIARACTNNTSVAESGESYCTTTCYKVGTTTYCDTYCY